MAVETPSKSRKNPKKSKDKGLSKSEKKRKSKAKKKAPIAETVELHDLYEKSVQGPEEDSKFFSNYYKKLTGNTARVFREDFCGTATLSCHWVQLHKENRAIGVDLHGPTLDWGRQRHVAAMTSDQQSRIELIEADVRAVTEPKADILAALNFSYCVFKKRADLREYIANCYESLADGGILCCDSWGGSETQVEQEEEREVEDFTYIWDQHKFDPLTYETTCKIHFEFKDGSRIDDAFVYEWRLWTLPELRELYEEVGFKDVHVLWEGTDEETDEGNGEFERIEVGDADDAWIAYVVGRK